MISSSKRHLAEVGETYFGHLGAALGFSASLVFMLGFDYGESP